MVSVRGRLALLVPCLLAPVLGSAPRAAVEPDPASALVDTKAALTFAGATAVIEAAVQKARSLGASPSIALVDDGGHLVRFVRLDGSFPAGAEVSIGKARTAATFHKPTAAFEESINKGRTAMAGLEGLTPLQGGVPIRVGERFVGGIGVSGAASAAEDEVIAAAGAAALSAGADAPVH